MPDIFINLLSYIPVDIDLLTRVLVVFVAAGLVGLERQLNKKPVGIRTAILVTFGSMLYAYYSVAFFSNPDVYHATGDPTRVIGQIVTGVGFLGAGNIISQGNRVSGITSAATIWVLAAIGVVIALGYYFEAIFYTMVILLVLNVIGKIETKLGIANRKES